jgi:uncharacterized membrane protein
MSFKEKQYRSIVKMLSWRVLATCATVLIVYMFTGNIKASFGIGAVEVVTKMILYYFHERSWNASTWGKYNPEKEKVAINDNDFKFL